MTVTTLAEVKETFGITDTEQDDLLQRWIGAVTKYIERKTRRSFTVVLETRLFDGYNKGYVVVDDFQSVTAVSLLNPDGTSYHDYDLVEEIRAEPYNSLPKNQLLLMNNVSENPYRSLGQSPYIFPRGYANIQVTANWGSYATPPEDLTDLAISMVGAKLNKRRTQGIASASIGGESVTFKDGDVSDEGMATLEAYKRPYVNLW